MYEFNIHKYSLYDLEKLFQLTNGTYTKKDILEKKQEFYEKIMNATTSQQQNPKLIKELTVFLDEASKLLVYFIEPQDEEEGLKYIQPKAPSLHQDKQRHTPQYEYGIKEDPSQEDKIVSSNFRDLDAKHRYESKQLYDRAKNEIIVPPKKPYQTVMQNEFNKGVINPIHTPILTKCLNIDTKFREELYKTKSTDFIFTLPDRIRKVVSMRLSAYEFPIYSIYNISKSYGNNYINVLCTYTPPPAIPSPTNPQTQTVIRTLTIPDGIYKIEKLIEELNNQLQPRDASMNLIYTNPDQNGIFNCIEFSVLENNKITIEVTETYSYKNQILAIGFDFTLNENKEKDVNTDTKTKMGWNLGFMHPKYYDKLSYESNTQYNLDTIKYIYLMVNDYNNSVNNNFFIGAFPKYVLNKNILARIPIQTSMGEMPLQTNRIQQENQLTQHMEPRRYFGPVDIQRLQIQIYDEYGRILDINNVNYSICLTFQCMYD